MNPTLPVLHLAADLLAAVDHALTAWDAAGNTLRLWARDSTLWTGADESRWLGWLDVIGEQLTDLGHLDEVAALGRSGEFDDAVVLGMGGSSLAPEVLASTLGPQPGFPRLSILDSTDPAQARALERRLNLSRTLFVVASKSGSTLEPNVFHAYFWERVRQAAGDAGRRFLAITDPGSPFSRVATEAGFRRILYGVPEIGGRFSALSNFGMVPAALLGLDVADFLARADQMAKACGTAVPAARNPGVILGTVLGVAASQGLDKMTIVASPALAALGAWLEQLIAESTGKGGKAIIPVDREPLGAPEEYGADRIFVYVRYSAAPDARQDAAVAALRAAGKPVVELPLGDLLDLGQEFFRWEIATAVAGHFLGIHPFNQPDVEASKIATRQLTEAYESAGALPAGTPVFEQSDVQLFTDEANAASLRASLPENSLAGWLSAHLGRLTPGDYFGLLAYLEMHPRHEELLTRMRLAVRAARQTATCAGFGPRFLHSTGQAYKGGPNTGVFLQITCEDEADLPIPGRRLTFGVVKAAQAQGDFQVLAERHRRVLRAHLRGAVTDSLTRLAEAMEIAARR
jgi:transaldolase/glucose-6-phosphate isomerase